MEPVQLIETMLFAGGRIRHLPFHMDRLRNSAAHFHYPVDITTVWEELQQKTGGLPRDGICKVRLLVDESGRFTIQTGTVDSIPDETGIVILSDRRVDSNHIFLYHKTTERSIYEAEYERARASGFDEILFMNEQGELTEGSRTNLIVEMDGVRYTPPVSSGLLPGTFRRSLLERKLVLEKVLYRSDLVTASGIYICNAVRGLRAVTMTN